MASFHAVVSGPQAVRSYAIAATGTASVSATTVLHFCVESGVALQHFRTAPHYLIGT